MCVPLRRRQRRTITLGTYDFDVPAGMRIAKGVTVSWGPQGAPDLTKPVRTAPPPFVVVTPTPACPPYVLTTTQPPPNKNNSLNTKVNGVHMSLTLAPGTCGHVGALYSYVRQNEGGTVAVP